MNTNAKFVTCHCKSCSGGIEFERELFDPENPAAIECPHCGLETHLYIPSPDEISNPPSGQETVAPEKRKRVRGARTSLTSTQCASTEGQELIQLLCEITRAGLVTEEGVRQLNVWLDGKTDSDIPAIKYLLQLPERLGKITTATAFDIHFAIEHVLPKNIRADVKARRQEAWLHSPLKPRATEAQLEYIRGLGGTVPPDINIAEASLLIEELLEKNPEKQQQATEKQLQYLKVFGYIPEGSISKEEASILIGRFSEDPERQRIRDENNTKKTEHEFAERERNLAYHLRSEYDEAKKSAEKAEADEIEDAKMYLNDAWNERLWFWQDTFRSPDQMEGAGMNEQAIKLFFFNGYRFKMPSEDSIRDVLEALDAFSPTWDKDTPEYFFSTLQQNFPEFLKAKIDFEELEVLREIYANP